MDDANVFNAKGKLQEVEALLERFIPSVERMQTQLDQYKVAFTDTTAENASLKKEIAELQSWIPLNAEAFRRNWMTRNF